MTEAGARGVGRRLMGDRWALLAVTLLVCVALIALGAPLLPLADPDHTELTARLLSPLSSGHWLGTDQLGRDILARLIFGTRLSLLVALAGVAVAASVGSCLGLLAGYYGGRVDSALMRTIDVLMAFPYLLLALAIVAMLGPGLENATLAIAIVNIPFFARTVRGQTLALKREIFVDAAKVAGLGDASILLFEILPSITSTIVVAASTSSGWMILETAGLSFLGLGAQPPTADLGGMLGQGRHLLATAPHVSLVPGAMIFFVVAFLNVLGDALRDALDPRRARHSPPATKPSARPGSEQLAPPQVGPERKERGLLRVEGLRVAFAGSVVVEDVSFEIRRREKVALVGESGSGKSVTALAVLSLLDPPGRIERGSICFDGVDVRRVSASELGHLRGGRIAWIPQDPMTSLHPLMRIERQLTEVLELHRGLRGEAARQTALELLRDVGISDPEARLSAWPHQLSGGMRQRVVIAMALGGEPDLLIADEPTTALDVTTQAGVLDRLRELCDRRGTALLFISHDLAVVSQLCDRVLVMNEGRLVESGSVRHIIEAPVHPYTQRLLAAVPELGNPAHILEGEGNAR